MANKVLRGLVIAIVTLGACGCGQDTAPQEKTIPPKKITVSKTEPVTSTSPGNSEIQAKSRAKETAPAHPRVVMETTLGKIVIELNEKKASITVKNFLRYVDEEYYNGTIFHRVIPTFMIQGGGFTSLTEKKVQGLHEPIQNEAKNGLKNTVGTIAMARTKAPHSATSQFFINVADNRQLDPPSFDGWGYCVFGQVVEGMETVDKIESVATTVRAGRRDVPADPVIIQSVTVE